MVKVFIGLTSILARGALQGCRAIISDVIRRLYVHNFRCLENFELPLAGQSSVLLLGKNGAGKTTVGLALEVLQKIARGNNRVDSLVRPKDVSMGRNEIPVRFEIEAELAKRAYTYSVAFESPPGWRELRVFDEKLVVDGMPIYSREASQVTLAKSGKESSAQFRIDWHLVALPIVQEQSERDPIFIFKRWLRQALILRPAPALITGDSDHETLEPDTQVVNFGAWFAGLFARSPGAYRTLDVFLKELMPDLEEITNPVTGKDARSLSVTFSNDIGSFSIPFADLSDGEKCFMICALVAGSNKAYGPLLCFWDEPDTYLALPEVGHFVMALRRTFQSGGQFIATSHNPEAIRRFSDENTFFLQRRNHMEPTIARPLSDLQINGDLVSALIRDEVPA